MVLCLHALLYFAVVALGLFASILLHELGHAIAAWLGNWTVFRFRVGAGAEWCRFKVRDTEVSFGAWPFSGFVLAVAKTPTFFRTKRLLFLLAGPAVDVILLAVFWRLSAMQYPRSLNWLFSAILLVLFFQLSMFCGSIFPRLARIEGRIIPNDMLQIWGALTTNRTDAHNQFVGHVFAAARTYLERGQTARAQATVEDAPIKPANWRLLDARILWIHLLLLLERKEQAQQVKRNLLEISNSVNATRVEILDGLACLPIFYGHDDMLEEALGYINEAISEAPDEITLKGSKSSLLIELGRVDEGLNLLETVFESTQSENDRAICSYYRALAASRLGDQQRAQELLHAAFKQFPDSIVRNRVAKLIFEPPTQVKTTFAS